MPDPVNLAADAIPIFPGIVTQICEHAGVLSALSMILAISSP
jgi:hypothetical protein